MENSASTTVNYRARQGLAFQQHRKGLLTRADFDRLLLIIHLDHHEPQPST